MKRFSPRWAKLALIAVVIAPLCVSLGWREVVGPCDYIAQGGLLLLMFALPFCTPLQTSLGKQFGLFYAVGFVWGVWRMAYFDQITRNGVPGSGYLVLLAM